MGTLEHDHNGGLFEHATEISFRSSESLTRTRSNPTDDSNPQGTSRVVNQATSTNNIGREEQIYLNSSNSRDVPLNGSSHAIFKNGPRDWKENHRT